jgi:hypothetical protein
MELPVDPTQEEVVLTIDALNKLLRLKDQLQLYVNFPAWGSVYQRSIRMTVVTLYHDVQEVDDHEVLFEELENQTIKRTARVSVGEIFGLMGNVRAIIAARTAEVTT